MRRSSPGALGGAAREARSSSSCRERLEEGKIAAVIDPLERWREHGEKPDYAGPAHLRRRSRTPQDPAELEGVDVAIVGAPTDDLVSDRPGTRFGPRAIRAASCPPGPHLEAKVDAFEELRIVDFGDAPVAARRPGALARGDRGAPSARCSPQARSRSCSAATTRSPSRTSAPARRTRPCRARPLRHAHRHRQGGLRRRGLARDADVPARRGGHVDPKRYVQIGLRGYWPGERGVRLAGGAGDHELLHARRPRRRASTRSSSRRSRSSAPGRSSSRSTSTSSTRPSRPAPARPSPAG